MKHLLFMMLLIGEISHSGCIGTVREIAGKLSAPEKVSSDFEDFKIKLHAKGEWKSRDLAKGGHAWNSQTRSGKIRYEMSGPSLDCVEDLAIIAGGEPGVVEDSLLALAAMNLLARAAGLSKEDAHPMSIGLMNDLPEDGSRVTKSLKGFTAWMTEFEGVIMYGIGKD